jgi:hypothetical protein
MPQLAKFASDYVLHAPVADRTGLRGSFDYRQPVAVRLPINLRRNHLPIEIALSLPYSNPNRHNTHMVEGVPWGFAATSVTFFV